MSSDHFRTLVTQMLTAASDAISFTDGLDKSDFLADKRSQQAVTMSLLILGEAATRSIVKHEELVTRHPEIPWNNMRGMRNRIAHGYSEINLELVWDTVKEELPKLLVQLQRLNTEG